MKKIILKICLIAVIQAVIISCTTKANTYYNRQMQPIVTKYNVLFNGEEALDKGLKELHEKYQDDFSEILPVEPIQMSGKIQLDGMQNADFERAEEKAIKTIQQHSMVFKGVQRNYKIDDAYILLGKARYYNERFLPALEAFNHLLTNYGHSERIPEAAIWVEKTNLRLGKSQLAIEKLTKLLTSNDLTKNNKAEAYATLGQAYIFQEEYPKAANALYLAGKFTKNSALRGRYYFIAAQLYENQRFTDSAAVAFEKVVKQNWKIPRKLWVEAQAGIARNKTFTPEEKNDFLTYLGKLENRYEHKNYLDVLYFSHGLLEEENNKNSAVNYYRNSLKNNKLNNSLKAKTHERIADIFFEKKNYTGAYHHLDSTLAYIPEHTLKRLYVERKKENLAKITELEYFVKQNDSILYIARLSDEEKRAFFQKHIDLLKEKTTQKKSQNTDYQAFSFNSKTENKKNEKFYFYNPMAVAYGKQQFQQNWGNRQLEDDWRWSSKRTNLFIDKQQNTDNQEVANETFDVNFYINQLPTENEKIKKIEKERNEALYQLGILYKSKFNDIELAVLRFERLLEFFPEPELEVATLYQLYKIYDELKNNKSEVIKNQIVSKFPISDYANLVKGEATAQQQKETEANDFLTTIKKDFEAGKLIEVNTILQKEKEKYQNTLFAPTIEMLNAQISARLYGISIYRENLEKIALKFPDTNESAEAKKLLTDLQSIENERFTDAKNATSWKIIIEGATKENTEKIRLLVKQKLENLSKNIVFSEDIYSPEQSWFVVHNLQNKETATSVVQDLSEILSKNKLQPTIISTENYRLVQIKKNFEEFKKL